MTLPNFLIIGPPRCATTWLHAVLRTHPEIFLPEEKQLHFFDRQFDKGIAWYASHFSKAGPKHKAIGEVTPDYVGTPGTLERISKNLPNVQIILVYRDPIDRMFNHYALKIRSGSYSGTPSFIQAMESDAMLLRDSRYDNHLKRCESLFPKKSIYIANFQTFQTSPTDELHHIFTFLGVSTEHTPPSAIMNHQYAKDRPPSKSKALSTVMRTTRVLLEQMPGGNQLVRFLRGTGLIEQTHRLNSSEMKLTLSEHDREVALEQLGGASFHLSPKIGSTASQIIKTIAAPR
ncbi:sulfotransferase family protein [Desulfovibrio ferrophilus]|uniref:[heparan sulfate]-glucosamine 3-sulfotransferase 1 n=1 Tax=Desulfovibrio ferrophilus TaxID=241368 RepID=A0A2Z6B232_9BACT|nr:sulfotransferase [Desulfovibrio ferrophilus]BBD09577.1 [heparan sulfate]-glucosamine 3-sulfotransferase 1 [Desulfovibrio ferrophilus]